MTGLPAEAVLPAVRVVTPFPEQARRRYVLLPCELTEGDMAALGATEADTDDYLREALWFAVGQGLRAMRGAAIGQRNVLARELGLSERSKL